MLLAVPDAVLNQSLQRQMRRENQEQRRTRMMEQCRMLTEERQELFSKMQKTDEEQQSLVSEMKAVDDQAGKIQKMEQLLETLVENRIQMREQMREMMPRMMQHMSEHMRTWRESGDDSLMDCPAWVDSDTGDGECYPDGARNPGITTLDGMQLTAARSPLWPLFNLFRGN